MSIILMIASSTTGEGPPTMNEKVTTPSGAASNCETGVQNATATVIENPGMGFDWAPNNPPQTVNSGEEISVSVQGGLPIYNWTIISGPGYSWQSSTTKETTNTLIADPSAICAATIAVTDIKGKELSAVINDIDNDFTWDSDSDKEFPAGETPVQVAVTGGVAPFQWSVSGSFSLSCTNDCGRSNTLSSPKTGCIGTITVIDACGQTVQGKVRRPGEWSTCFRHKGTICYNSPCKTYHDVDFGDHKASMTCCYSGWSSVTGTCGATGFQYTAKPSICTPESGCNVDPKIWALNIYYWKCN